MGDESDGGSEIGFGQDDVNGRTPPGFSTSPPATTTAAADTTVAVAAAAVSTDDTVLATTASPIEVAPAANPLADAPTDIDTSHRRRSTCRGDPCRGDRYRGACCPACTSNAQEPDCLQGGGAQGWGSCMMLKSSPRRRLRRTVSSHRHGAAVPH